MVNVIIGYVILEKQKQLEKKRETYFANDSTLTDLQKKWCRCILNILRQQKPECRIYLGLSAKEKREYPKIYKCYNPYSICTNVVKKPLHFFSISVELI